MLSVSDNISKKLKYVVEIPANVYAS